MLKKIIDAPDSFNAVVRGKHGYFVFNKYDTYVGKSLEKYGEFSELESLLFQDICKPGAIVVEVGANIGAHTVCLARLVGEEGRVYAFEPQPVVFQTLCANLALNSVENVGCYPLAVSATAGELLLPDIDYRRDNNFGGVELRRADAQSTGRTRKVTAVSLDDWLDLPRLDFLKIDVEGMESEVIQGARTLIQRHRPVLYVENDRIDRSANLIRLIGSLQYRLYWHLPPLYNPDNYANDPENLFPGIVSVNLLCIPEQADVAVPDLPAVADAWFHPLLDVGEVLKLITEAWRSGRRDEALSAAHRWLETPRLGAALLVPLTELLRQLGDLPAALAAGQRAVQAAPEQAAAHNNLGLVFLDRHDAASAQACFERALACDPAYVKALHNLAKMRIDQGDLADAEALSQRALEQQPHNPRAWTLLAGIARRRYAPTQALSHCERALAIDPEFLRARLMRAEIQQELGQAAEAERELRRVLDQHPHHADAWIAWGQFLERANRPGDSHSALTRAASLRPQDESLQVALADLSRKRCDWRDWPAQLSQVLASTRAALADGRTPTLPALTCLRFPIDPAEQLAIAQAHARRIAAQVAGLPPLRPSRAADSPLRIGLLSHEFLDNVVGNALRHLPAAFDRERFEIHAFVYNPDDGSAIRRDLLAGCDDCHDLTALGLWDAAQAIAEQGIALLLDINSYMQKGRPEIAALRPAPIQASYLYPGSMGAPWIDYVLVDEIILPPEEAARYYQEKPVYLPPCYLPSTGRTPIAADCPDRAAYGLPEKGLVFCSFNKEDKIDPDCFAAWLKILHEVADAVLWLAADEPAREGLRRAAAAGGIDPKRLVFAEREPDRSVHLARHRHADLFLDTFIHTAHVTAADALWAGLPILTRLGSTLAGRVAASLSNAAGLAEFVAADSDDYVRRALALAHDRPRLAALRQDWASRRETHPLFQSAAIARHLENAFALMWQRHCQGEPPSALHLNGSQRE